jgi:hypothetical protein
VIYLLPRDWLQTQDLKLTYNEITLPGEKGRRPNIVIRDQHGTSTLSELKTKYERDLPNALQNYKLESSELVVAEDCKEMVKIIHTNMERGVAVRQVNYIIQIGNKRLFVAFTAGTADGNHHDEQFDHFVRSIAKPRAN